VIKNFLVRGIDHAIIICPGHELKSNVNAIFHSQPGGSRLLNLNPEWGTAMEVSWQLPKLMWQLDNAREKRNQHRENPKLTSEIIEHRAFSTVSVPNAVRIVEHRLSASM